MANEFTTRKGLIATGGSTDTSQIRIEPASNGQMSSPTNGSIEYFYNGTINRDYIPCFTTRSTRHIIQLGMSDYLNTAITKTSTTTLGSILSISLSASTAYSIEVFCNIDATNGNGMKGAMTTSGIISGISTYSNLFSGTSTVSGTRTNGTAFGATEFSSTTTTSGSFQLRGTIFTSLSAVTLEFKGAQASSGAASTTFLDGAYILATPIFCLDSF